MPFESEAQRRYLWAKHPEIARRWTREYGSTPRDKVKAALERRKRGKSGGY